MIGVSVVIATRFGGETLLRCLEAADRELKASGVTGEIVLVVDGAPGEALAGIRDVAPGTRIVRHEHPLGVAAAYNRGFAEARGEFAALLNDDMLVEPGYLQPALAILENKRVFAATGHIIESGSGAVCCGRNALRVNEGRLSIDTHREIPAPYAFYATGGGLFRRALFLELGGFSSLYAPFYWEDVHVSYQAWTRGYEIHYSPSSRVLHHHRATVSRVISSHDLARVMDRNQWLFAWANLTSPAFTRRLVKDGLRVTVAALRGRDSGGGYLDAHARLPQALRIRRQTSRERTVSDEAIWARVGAP